MENLEAILATAEAALVQLESMEPEALRLSSGVLADATDPLDAVSTVHVMAALKTLYERTDEVKKAVGKAYDHVRVLVLPTKMDAEGIDGMTVAGIGRVSITGDIHTSMVDREAAFLWLEENGHGDVIQETVNASTLKALLRKRLREGQEIPETLFKVSPFDRASITKA